MASWTSPITWTTSMALSVARLNEQLRDNLTYLYDLLLAHKTRHASGGGDILYYKRQETWHIAGTVAVGVTQRETLTYRGPSGTIVRADAVVETAPVGADLIIDIHKNAGTIWTTQANRLRIVAGNTSGTTTTFDLPAIVDGQVLTLDIDQVGSSTAGADLTVRLTIACPLETS